MTTTRRAWLAAALAALLSAVVGCYDDVKVVQGTVVSFDEQGTVVEVKDERAPNATATYHMKERATMKNGDLVRIAFRDGADGKHVVRLMNVTRQKAKRQAEKH
jgi:hypothetical protein